MYASPVPGLVHLLAESASRGVIVLGALQDLAQAQARWGRADGFLTLWRYVVVMRNIRDLQTLKLLSELGGKYDHPTASYSQQYGNWTRSESHSHERRDRLPIDVISNGDPAHHGEELVFGPDGWQYFRPFRYFQAPFAPMLHSVRRIGTEAAPDTQGPPLPDLARGATTAAWRRSHRRIRIGSRRSKPHIGG